MTCAEKYLKEHPGEQIQGCPHDHGYLPKPERCMEISCFGRCWAREFPEVTKTIKNRKENKK